MKTPVEEEGYDVYVGRVARGAGIGTFGQGLGRVLAYVTQVTLARFYGPAQLGFYALGVTIVGFANIVAQFGLHNPVVRYVARYRTEQDIPRMRGTIILTVGTSFALSIALSILMFLSSGFLANVVFGKPALEPLFRIFSISVPSLTLMSMTLYATQGFQTVKYYSLVQLILQPLLNLGLIVILYWLGADVIGATAAYGISMAAGAALALYYLNRMFPSLLDRHTRPVFESRAVFRDSGHVFVAVSAEYVNAWTGVAVLGILATSEDVGIFNAAARTAMVSGVVYMAFTQIFSPIISNLYARGQLADLSRLYKDVSRWIFTGVLAVFWLTVILSRDILAVFGDQFIVGWSAMVISAGGWLFAASIGATNRVLLMTGHQRVYMFAMVAAAVTGIVASFALVPILGILGAALSDAGTTVLANTITLIAVRRKMNLWPYTRQYLKPLIASMLAAAATLLVKIFVPLPEGILSILLIAPLFAAIFGVTLVSLGLYPSDRQLLSTVWVAVRQRAS